MNSDFHFSTKFYRRIGGLFLISTSREENEEENNKRKNFNSLEKYSILRKIRIKNENYICYVKLKTENQLSYNISFTILKKKKMEIGKFFS